MTPDECVKAVGILEGLLPSVIELTIQPPTRAGNYKVRCRATWSSLQDSYKGKTLLAALESLEAKKQKYDAKSSAPVQDKG